MKVLNSQGKIYYGMHFYPGLAEYREEGKDPYRVYLNEDTIRSMGPTFAGKPIFVEHVDGVEENIDELRKEADGWVIESFYNAADGKHWAKFIITSSRGEKAIANGLRLSNAYFPVGTFGPGGQWNGIDYSKQILNGEYEHLAIVRHPRYEESVIMTPEQFKEYNDNHAVELKRLANSKDEKGKKMKLGFFKKTKVENAIEGDMSIVLPKSKREITVEQLVTEADERAVKNEGNEGLADMSHKVKMHDGTHMNVGDLMAKHKAVCDELEAMKKPKEENEEEPESDLSMSDGGVDSESVPEMQNEEDDEDAVEKKKKMDADKKANEEKADKEKKANAKKKADTLKNAHLRNAVEEVAVVEFSDTQVARGKAKYGSN